MTRTVTAGIVHLLVARRTSGRREIEQGPEWFDRSRIARLAGRTKDGGGLATSKTPTAKEFIEATPGYLTSNLIAYTLVSPDTWNCSSQLPVDSPCVERLNM